MKSTDHHIWLLRRDTRFETAWAILASLSLHAALFLLLLSSDLDNPLRGNKLQFDIVWIGESFAAKGIEDKALDTLQAAPWHKAQLTPPQPRDDSSAAIASMPSSKDVALEKAGQLAEREDTPALLENPPSEKNDQPDTTRPMQSQVREGREGDAARVPGDSPPPDGELVGQKVGKPQQAMKKTTSHSAARETVKSTVAVVPKGKDAGEASRAGKITDSSATEAVRAKALLPPAPRADAKMAYDTVTANYDTSEAAQEKRSLPPASQEIKKVAEATAGPVASKSIETKKHDVPPVPREKVKVAEDTAKGATRPATSVVSKTSEAKKNSFPASRENVRLAKEEKDFTRPTPPVASKTVEAKVTVRQAPRDDLKVREALAKGPTRPTTPVASKTVEVKQDVPVATRADVPGKDSAKSVTADASQAKGLMVPVPRGDLKMKVVGDGVKLTVLLKDHPSRLSKRGKGAVQRLHPVAPIVVNTGNNSSEAVIEKAQEGVYIFDAGPIREDAKATFTFRILEGTSKERVVTIGRRTISGRTELIKILMPEAIIWSDDAAFTGSINDSNSTTKFNSDTGLYWKEYNN